MVWGGYSDFYLLQGLGLFFGVQNFEFRYFFMCRSFVNYFYGYANLSVYFGGGGYVIFHRYFFGGVSFKNVYFVRPLSTCLRRFVCCVKGQLGKSCHLGFPLVLCQGTVIIYGRGGDWRKSRGGL